MHAFDEFRAEGAFLVSAAWSDGRVTSLRIRSERGGLCRVQNPWPARVCVSDATGRKAVARQEGQGAIAFETQPGGVYCISPDGMLE